MSQTIEADRGRTSAANAYGSAFSIRSPRPLGRMLYLYLPPGPTPATRLSQIPEFARGRSGVALGSQPLKSPITLTASASGAQVAKNVARRLSLRLGCAPRLR